MAAPRRIAVVTGTRAEYGLLYWILHDLRERSDVDLRLIVTGMHLSPEFGHTVDQIEADGFEVHERVEMLLSADTPTAIAKSMGLGTIGMADALARQQPDILVVLGDRFEILAAAQAALVARIPIAHLHGGEVTEGAFDDSIRHAITKMSHLHFVATEEYRRRVIQLGEAPERVFKVGAPGLEHLLRTALPSKAELEEALGIALDPPVFLVTYHPVTLADEDPAVAMGHLLDALDSFPDARVVLTYANADTYGRRLIAMVEEFAAKRPGRAVAVSSLGQRRYLGVMALASAVIGNSSSGIVEAPAMGVPTVNLGIRQAGRTRASSVIDCAEETDAIADAIESALGGERAEVAGIVPNPYGNGEVAASVIDVLSSVDLPALIPKRFYDLASGC